MMLPPQIPHHSQRNKRKPRRQNQRGPEPPRHRGHKRDGPQEEERGAEDFKGVFARKGCAEAEGAGGRLVVREEGGLCILVSGWLGEVERYGMVGGGGGGGGLRHCVV